MTVKTSRKEKKRKGVVNKWEKNRESATLARNEKNIKGQKWGQKMWKFKKWTKEELE